MYQKRLLVLLTEHERIIARAGADTPTLKQLQKAVTSVTALGFMTTMVQLPRSAHIIKTAKTAAQQ